MQGKKMARKPEEGRADKSIFGQTGKLSICNLYINKQI